MSIQSRDIPQADRLDSVISTTIAVANGATTDIQIANHVPGIEGDGRQGRYYRKAAEILGFVRNDWNNATITAKGLLITQNPTLANPVLLESVVNLNLYQKLIPYFEQNSLGLTQRQIINYLQSISDPTLGPTMIPRRISTILAWLRALNVIEIVEEKYRLSNEIIHSIPIIALNDIEQPILPTRNSTEYKIVSQRIFDARDVVTFYRNQAKTDRANHAHTQLVNMVAGRISEAGGIPRFNPFIDLAARITHDYIFEMKSTTETNVKSQIRRGISQLYEYRYIENKPNAKLILVLENPLAVNNRWLLDYVEIDRNINLIWDGNNSLYGTESTRNELDFLGLLPP